MLAGIILLCCICLYLLLRLLLLHHTIRMLAWDFGEARKNLNGEQHVQLSSPDRDLELLAAECNAFIAAYFKERANNKIELQDIRREITNLSHDLRTPITSILGYVDLLMEDCLNMEQAESLEVVKRRSEDLNSLIGQLYDYARLESRELEIGMQPLDLLRIFREHVLSFYQEFERRGISLTLKLPEEKGAVWIAGDETCIQRVLDNLISNALKYSSKQVSMLFESSEKQVSVTYQTNRENLNDYDIAHLFDRFYKKDLSRSGQKGSGLGLTITKLYVEQMAGSIEAFGDAEHLYLRFWFPRLIRE